MRNSNTALKMQIHLSDSNSRQNYSSLLHLLNISSSNQHSANITCHRFFWQCKQVVSSGWVCCTVIINICHTQIYGKWQWRLLTAMGGVCASLWVQQGRHLLRHLLPHLAAVPNWGNYPLQVHHHTGRGGRGKRVSIWKHDSTSYHRWLCSI